MEAIDGDMTQEDYSKIRAMIANLHMLEILGEDHSEELKKLKEQIEYFDDEEEDE